MNSILLPVMSATRDLAYRVFSLYVETSQQGTPHPVASHLLATYAPRASAAIATAQSYRQFMDLQRQAHIELMPWLRGLVEAIFDTSVAERTLWGRQSADPYRLEKYMEASYPHWSSSWIQSGRLMVDRATTQFQDLLLETTIQQLEVWWVPHMENYPWHLWHLTWCGEDALINPGEDYRVVEWTRQQRLGGRFDPVAPEHVDNDTVAGEESWEAVNAYVNERIRHERDYELKVVTGDIKPVDIGPARLLPHHGRMSDRDLVPSTPEGLAERNQLQEVIWEHQEHPPTHHTLEETLQVLERLNHGFVTPTPVPITKKPKSTKRSY